MSTPPEELVETANRITDMSGKMRQAILETSAGIVKNAADNASRERMGTERANTAGASKGKVALTVETALLKAKTPREKAEVLEEAYSIAMRDGDEEGAAKYAMRAVEARKRAAEDITNQGLAKPSIDSAAVANLPARPAPAAVAPIAGGGGAPAPVAPTGRVVIYKDGKPVGHVPANQVQDAISQGYSTK
jgi:hypothetical protein